MRYASTVQVDLSVGIAVDFHGFDGHQPGCGHGVPDAQLGQKALAGGRNGVDARVVAVGIGGRHRRARRQDGDALAAAGQRQGGGQADDAGAANDDLMAHLAEGSPACVGHSTHIWPRCFMRPAC
ncbi:hypothetical protein G6F24_016995 [Rhizopus arrhizus]|nr:hypothetical protein G6F24_016995 [Rhizopus arrhizus]